MNVAEQDKVEANTDSESHHLEYAIFRTSCPLKDVPSRTDALRGQTCLGDALNEEYLLSRVLGHLVDDGLYECRRVCRKWRDVCSLLTMKLVDVRKTTFRDAAREFPNATSVSMAAGGGWSADDFSECLSSFTRLKHLSLHGTGFGENDWLPDWLDSYSLSARVPFLSQLESLTLNPIPGNDASWISMVGTYLTNLTQLKIGRNSSGGWWNVNPLSETHKLKSLSIHTVQLFNSKGKLIFPPSANLTRFEVRAGCLYGADPFPVRHPTKEASLHNPQCVCSGIEAICIDNEIVDDQTGYGFA